LEHEDLTDKIIGAAIQVHRTLGPGFIGSIYENALVIELRKRGLRAEQQLEAPITCDGEGVGKHRLDLLVEGTIVVENKAIKDIEDIHFAVARSYLKAVGLKHGLILNFARPKLQVKRVIRE
jgi:GxxExxY protein